MSKLAFLVAAAALIAAPAHADGVTLSARVLQEQIVEQDGVKRVVMVPAAKVTPGDAVIYDLSFANKGRGVAEQVVLTNPIPATLEFVSAPGADVSVDGGRTFGPLAALKIAQADGKFRPALAADVTHVRWKLAPLAPGSAGHVLFRAKLK